MSDNKREKEDRNKVMEAIETNKQRIQDYHKTLQAKTESTPRQNRTKSISTKTPKAKQQDMKQTMLKFTSHKKPPDKRQ
jgi:predicted HAD superfamily Cof-like phosphohydrolase